MAVKIGKIKYETIIARNKVLIHFSLYKFRKHNTASEHHTAQSEEE